MKLRGRILIRVDGGKDIGMGHIVRTITLARQLKLKGVKPIFVIKDYDLSVVQLLKREKFSSQVIARRVYGNGEGRLLKKIMKDQDVQSIIVDVNHKYYLDRPLRIREMIGLLKEAGKRVVFIDGGTKTDCVSLKFDVKADAVLMPYVGAEHSAHRFSTEVIRLLGPKYFVFSEEFQRLAKKKKIIREQVKKILVFLGGADAEKSAQKVLKALTAIPGAFKVTVVQGVKRKPRYLKDLKKLVKAQQNFRLVSRVDSMARALYETDLAILGSGLTKYEAAMLGTPVISLLPEQYQSVYSKGFENQNLCVPVTNMRKIGAMDLRNTVEGVMKNVHKRRKLSDKGKSTLDLNGFNRIWKYLAKEFV